MKTKIKSIAKKALIVYMIICTIIVTGLLVLINVSIFFFSDSSSQNSAVQEIYTPVVVEGLRIPKYSEGIEHPVKIIKIKRGIEVSRSRLFFAEDVVIEEMDKDGKIKNTKKMKYGYFFPNNKEIIEIKTPKGSTGTSPMSLSRYE